MKALRIILVIHRQNEADLKVKYAISSVDSMLPQNLFLRIHRSYIVSIKKVSAFTINDVEIGKIELPIGRSYPDVFKKLTNDNSFLPIQTGHNLTASSGMKKSGRRRARCRIFGV